MKLTNLVLFKRLIAIIPSDGDRVKGLMLTVPSGTLLDGEYKVGSVAMLAPIIYNDTLKEFFKRPKVITSDVVSAIFDGTGWNGSLLLVLIHKITGKLTIRVFYRDTNITYRDIDPDTLAEGKIKQYYAFRIRKDGMIGETFSEIDQFVKEHQQVIGFSDPEKVKYYFAHNPAATIEGCGDEAS